MKKKIDFFDPTIIFAVTYAFAGDLSFFLVAGIFIPVVGIVFLAFALAGHYIAGCISTAFLWGKTSGWLPKLVLIASIVQPIPLLSVGVFLAIILSNKVISFIAEQAAIQVVAAFTGGAGEALEGVAATKAGAEGARLTTQAARATSGVTRGIRVAGTAARDTGEAMKETGAAEKIIKPDVFGKRPLPMEELKKELVGEKPFGEKIEGTFKKIGKIKDQLEKFRPEESGEEEDEEELREAA